MSVDAAVDRALDFLATRQRASGDFPMALWRPADPNGATIADSTPFAAALIAHSLGFADDPRALTMVGGAVRFVRDRMERGGVWRYWRLGPERDRMPADVDDIACCSDLLHRHGIPVPDNRRLLLANRDKQGRFYTWIVPRPTWGAEFWRVAAGFYMRPLRARRFWRNGEARPDDLDGVVNANVLRYLGATTETAPVLEYLSAIVRDGSEEACDRWYQSVFAFHHMLARCHAAGVTAVGVLRDESVRRLAARARPDGSFGETALDTALAACALADWDAAEPLAAAAAAHLRRVQLADGSWPRAPSFWGGPTREWAFGSEELTTAHCLEAIVRCPPSSSSMPA